VAPTPSLQEAQLCHVALRRSKLAHLSNMKRRPQACPLGCQPAEGGDGGGRFWVPKSAEYYRHLERECPNRFLSCRNPGCNARLRACEMVRHEAAECDFAQQQLQLTRNHADKHRLVSCPLECGRQIPKKDVNSHLKFDCAQRVVRCKGLLKHMAATVDKQANNARCCVTDSSDPSTSTDASYFLPPTGCGKQLPLRSLLHHLKHECPYEQRKHDLAQASKTRQPKASALSSDSKTK
jgi:hypothetical protein